MFDYDDEPDNDETPSLGAMSFKNLQQEALQLFGRVVKKVSGANIPDAPPVNAEKYLTMAEIEGIIKEHGEEMSGGFIVGGDTEEEARQKIGRLMEALMERILSNLMAEGVKAGHLDCAFDSESNEFEFQITEKGRQYSAECRNKADDHT
jgi:hypothetical protein